MAETRIGYAQSSICDSTGEKGASTVAEAKITFEKLVTDGLTVLHEAPVQQHDLIGSTSGWEFKRKETN